MQFPRPLFIMKALFGSVPARKRADVKKKLLTADVNGVRENLPKWAAWADAEGDKVNDVNPLRVCDLPKIMAAFNIEDVDVLLDLCCHYQKLNEPLIIRSADREKVEPLPERNSNPAPEEAGQAAGPGWHLMTVRQNVWADLAKRGRLDGHRMLMERMVLGPKTTTVGGQHCGQEAFFVIEGKIRVSFPGKFRDVTLGQWDYLSFNSMTTHQVHNEEHTEAVVIVSRTMRAGEYRHLTAQ